MGASELLASIAPRAIDGISINGGSYSIAPLAADVWLDILAQETWSMWEIVPELIDDMAAEGQLADALIDGTLSNDSYREMVHDIITIAAGRPWWSALRLISSAVSEEVGGWTRSQLVLHHIDASKLSLAAWLDALYGIYTQHMDGDKRNSFDAQLLRPPPGLKAKVDPKASRARFMAAMGDG